MTIATGAVLAAVIVASVVAAATYREYGLEPSPRPEADCPEEPCRATGRVTGIQVQNVRDGKRIKYPTRIRKRNGWLVAFSLTLGKPTKEQTRFFNRLWGSPASARISVLTPDPQKGDRKNRNKTYTLHNQSEVFTLNRYFGKKAWFVLKKRIHVRKRQVLALTLPTWAPVLSSDLSTSEKWRASRNPKDCEDVTPPAAQQKLESLKSYRCLYTTARVLYTALVVNKTPQNKN